MRPLGIFDSAMKLDYDDAFACLVDARTTHDRYQFNNAVDELLASNYGFARVLADPDLQKKVDAAAVLRDRMAKEAMRDQASSLAAAEREYRDRVARINERHRSTAAEIFRQFETAQAGALHFCAARLVRATHSA